MIMIMVACDDKSELEQKKEELKSLKSEIKELQKEAKELVKEIAELDPEFGKDVNRSILITALNVESGPFEHRVEVRGTVESRRNVMIGAEIPGKIDKIYVEEGQRVSKGHKLLELDADIIKNNIAELRTSLNLAEVVFERQQNLWNQNIGTEIKYLEAKNAKESLERKLATANAQLAQAIIRAPFSGSIDLIPSKEGEIIQPGMPLIRIVNPDDVYIKSSISEKFIGSFQKGDEVGVTFPIQNKTLTSRISSVGQVINTENRTFEIEIALPKVPFSVKPNQVVILDLQDYQIDQTIKVPTRLILRDNKGSFVYKVDKMDDQMYARKAHILLGVSYNGETEVVDGLKENEVIANKGFRELADGVAVQLADDKSVSMKALATEN